MNYIPKHELHQCITVKSIYTIYKSVSMHTRSPKPESHDFLELGYVSDCVGEHKFTVGGKVFSMKKGDFFIIPPNEVHVAAPFSKSIIDMISFEIDGDISPICKKVIRLNGKDEETFSELMNEGARLFTGMPLPGFQKGISPHERSNPLLLQKFKNQLENFLIDIYLLETEPDFSIGQKGAEAELDKIVCFMKNNVNKKITLTDISLRFSMSKTKIQRLFYKYKGVAPMQFFTDLKLSAAKKMMFSTSLNASEIARRLDFSSVNYFSRLFKAKIGKAPSEYVKSIKNSKNQGE